MSEKLVTLNNLQDFATNVKKRFTTAKSTSAASIPIEKQPCHIVISAGWQRTSDENTRGIIAADIYVNGTTLTTINKGDVDLYDVSLNTTSKTITFQLTTESATLSNFVYEIFYGENATTLQTISTSSVYSLAFPEGDSTEPTVEWDSTQVFGDTLPTDWTSTISDGKTLQLSAQQYENCRISTGTTNVTAAYNSDGTITLTVKGDKDSQISITTPTSTQYYTL